MSKGNLILILLLVSILMSCQNEKSLYAFRGSPNFYFQSNFLDSVEYKGQVNEAGVAEGEWMIDLEDSKMEVDLQNDFLSNLDYVIPSQYELKKKRQKEFVWYTYEDKSIMIFLDTIKSLDLKGAEIILDEVSGISQICLEDESCTPIDYQGNIIEYQGDYFSGVYHFIEKKDDQIYHKIGYVTYNNKQLILFVNQFSENSSVKLNQSLFSLLLENIRVNDENLVPSISKFKRMKSMDFSAVLNIGL